jgi:pimeloyl-ACP methyl ester carboxylesterase
MIALPRPAISRNSAASVLSWSMAFPRVPCERLYSRSSIPISSHALRSTPWCGPAKVRRHSPKKKLPEFKAKNRRPIDKAFIHSIFDRDHPGTAEEKVIDAFADAVTALDDSVPTGTYVDMCSRLPVVDPTKISVPTLIMRGQWDGIASFEDLVAFFAMLPNPDKHFAVMPGISHASFQQKNYALVYHILWSFFAQPAPVYRG